MVAALKPKWIVGNWKMHKTLAEAKAFVHEIGQSAAISRDVVALAVPFTCLSLSSYFLEHGLRVGAQNLYFEKSGAFTGEVSAEMLLDAGATFVLIGHSERRNLFQETDELINKKVKSALSAGLKVILCVGETQVERIEGRFEARLSKQLTDGLKGVGAKFCNQLIVAYEPIWAIGTGLPATVDIANECHAFCRKVLSDLYGQEKAEGVPLLYGGSVIPDNAKEFLTQKEINGLLIGKASLSSELFVKIINYV